MTGQRLLKTDARSEPKNGQAGILALVFFCAVVFFSLMMRDSFGHAINKYLLLLICAVPTLTFNVSNLCVFYAFLFPLYIGLPGNYITLVLFIRFGFEVIKNKFRFDLPILIMTLALTAIIAIQNLKYGFTDVYYMVGALNFLLLFFYMKLSVEKCSIEKIVIFYTLGVLSTAFIMLVTTLNYYSVSELLSSSSRFGAGGMLDDKTVSSMVVSIDPNFLGMDAIAAVASSSLIVKKMDTALKRTSLIILIVLTAVIPLLGLSRSYVIALAFWALIYIMSQRSLKNKIIFIVAAAVVVVLSVVLFPDVYSAILNRFSEADVSTGNGRIDLIIKYAIPWNETLSTLLFGIGLYVCHTHCAPLLYLFGIGIFGFLILAALELRYIRLIKGKNRVGIKGWVPFIATLFMSATIPAAGAISYVFPLFLTILVLGIGKDEQSRYEHQTR